MVTLQGSGHRSGCHCEVSILGSTGQINVSTVVAVKKTSGPQVSDIQLTSEIFSIVAVNVPGSYEVPRVSNEWILGMLVVDSV